MNARDFCCWLLGWFELSGSGMPALSSAQVQPIRAQLAMVRKVDPVHSNLFVAWLDMRLRGVDALDLADTAEVRRLLLAQVKHGADTQPHGDEAYAGDPDLMPRGTTLGTAGPPLPTRPVLASADPNTVAGTSENPAQPRYAPKAMIYAGSGPVIGGGPVLED